MTPECKTCDHFRDYDTCLETGRPRSAKRPCAKFYPKVIADLDYRERNNGRARPPHTVFMSR